MPFIAHRPPSNTWRQQSAQPPTRTRNIPVGVYLIGSVMIMLICNIIVIQTKLASWEKEMETTTTASRVHAGIPPPLPRFLPSNTFSEAENQQSQTTSHHQKQQQQQHLGLLYAFTIRDSVRLNGNPPLPRQMHIFDYVDVSSAKQTSGKQKLYLDGYFQGEIPCGEYSIDCYSKKIIQTFSKVLQHSTKTTTSTTSSTNSSSVYYFYMESDNDLCVSLEEIRDLAFEQQRYFISTGIGASGWIMSSQFMKDFVSAYQTKPKNTTSHQLQPDVHASEILTRSQSPSWSVTRQYLVQHSLVVSPSTTHQGLTLDTYNLLKDKHLPRCFEPHRGLWPIDNGTFINYDVYGWDYFDYDKCPTAFVFPCGDNQIPLSLTDIAKPAPLKFAERYQKLQHQRQEEQQRKHGQQQQHQQYDMSLQKLQQLGFVRGAGVGVTDRGTIGGKAITLT